MRLFMDKYADHFVMVIAIHENRPPFIKNRATTHFCTTNK